MKYTKQLTDQRKTKTYLDFRKKRNICANTFFMLVEKTRATLKLFSINFTWAGVSFGMGSWDRKFSPNFPEGFMHSSYHLKNEVPSKTQAFPLNLLLKNTAWKVSKYGVFSGSYFPVFGLCQSLYLVQIQKNTDQKKLHNWALFTQWKFSVNGQCLQSFGWVVPNLEKLLVYGLFHHQQITF